MSSSFPTLCPDEPQHKAPHQKQCSVHPNLALISGSSETFGKETPSPDSEYPSNLHSMLFLKDSKSSSFMSSLLKYWSSVAFRCSCTISSTSTLFFDTLMS